MTISPMTNKTVAAVAALERLCFANPWSLDALESELLNPLATYLVAEEDGQLAGYAGMHCVVDEGYVTNVAVAPAFRRRGVARELMLALEVLCRRRRMVFLSLEVRVSNTGAIALYRGLGYGQAGLRPGYYSHPTEDALLMTKTFEREGRHEDTCVRNLLR